MHSKLNIVLLKIFISVVVLTLLVLPSVTEFSRPCYPIILYSANLPGEVLKHAINKNEFDTIFKF